VSDYLGNLRNVFYYDYYNTLQLGEAIWYNPFGKQDSVIVAGTNPHRFSYNGKELDESLDLDRYYYGARYYDPELGRFTSPDPISDDWTPYSYVRNNPIAYNDPTGMSYSGGGGNPELVGSDNPDPDSWGRPDPFNPIADAIANSMPGDVVTVYNRYGRPVLVHQERTKETTGGNMSKEKSNSKDSPGVAGEPPKDQLFDDAGEDKSSGSGLGTAAIVAKDVAAVQVGGTGSIILWTGYLSAKEGFQADALLVSTARLEDMALHMTIGGCLIAFALYMIFLL
jgi:RHS repeat-associated protein